MPYDPNNPNQDPRQQMSSGGPATGPVAPQQPSFGRGNGPFVPNSPLLGSGNPLAPGQQTATQAIYGNTWLNNAGRQNDFVTAADQAAYGTPAATAGPPQIPGTGADGSGGGGGYAGVGTLQGLDMTQPGALEQYQQQMGGYFGTPSLSEMYAKQALSNGTGPDVTNRAEQAYQQFAGSQPANMSPYYDNQRRIAEENIRKTMAARGSYGSSASDDLYNEMYTNLAADQAQKEAQYGLSRGQLLGSLAQGADQSSLAGSANQRNWESALANIAGGGDAASLSRVMGGANVASGAQAAQRGRGQDAFNNQLQMGDRMSGIMGQGYGNIFGTDLDLMKTITGLNTGTVAEGYNQASQQAIQQRQNVSNLNNLFGGNTQMARGIYDAVNSPANPEPSPMPSYYQNPNGEAELRRAWGYNP
jgi:hypothetical protein